jgi:hypothetical protein
MISSQNKYNQNNNQVLTDVNIPHIDFQMKGGASPKKDKKSLEQRTISLHQQIIDLDRKYNFKYTELKMAPQQEKQMGGNVKKNKMSEAISFMRIGNYSKSPTPNNFITSFKGHVTSEASYLEDEESDNGIDDDNDDNGIDNDSNGIDDSSNGIDDSSNGIDDDFSVSDNSDNSDNSNNSDIE